MPIPPPPQLLSVLAVCLCGYALAVATWPLRHCSATVRRSVLIPLWLGMAATPFFMTWIPPQPRSLVAIVLGGVLPCKLLDAYLTAATWRTLPFVEWLKFLAHPTVLVRRLHMLEPPRTFRDNALTFLRGVAQVLVGQWVFMGWVMHWDVLRQSFWFEQLALTAALYVIFFEGGNVMATGFFRCLGSNVTDLSRWIYVSASPADFWRRYNRNAGQFFGEDVFKHAGGLRKPIRAVYATFMLNGLLHEYFIAAAVGRVYGYMLVFFFLQATAVALTFRLRVRSTPGRVIGAIATFAVNALTAVFFFGAIDKLVPLYRFHRVLP